MALTLKDLASTPELRSRFVSGSECAYEAVSWAHVCELPDPTEWLGKGDLLMTTGMGIPAEAGEQCFYVERLHAGGLAGLMIGDNMQAPANLDALIAKGNELGFPILMTEYGVPFSAVTKTVMEAYKQQEFELRNATTKVYETARLRIRGVGLLQLLVRLGKDVGATLHLLDSRTLDPWVAALEELPSYHKEALHARPRAVQSTPMLQRCVVGKGETVLMPIPSQMGCLLAAHSLQALDYGLLHHLVAIVGIELERIRVQRETNLRIGGELIDDLLQGRVAARQAQERLRGCGADLARLRMAVTKVDRPLLNDIDEMLGRRGHDLILRAQGDELIFLFWDDEGINCLQRAFDLKVGVSDFFDYSDDCSSVLREAKLALAHSSVDRPVSFYLSSDIHAPWLPQSLHDAAEAFKHVLGALAEYDSGQSSQLLHTLRIFLESNRSWVVAAQKLHIHKQTLVYRVRRIEEITGRSLDSTDDVAILWFALKSAELTGISTRQQVQGGFTENGVKLAVAG